MSGIVWWFKFNSSPITHHEMLTRSDKISQLSSISLSSWSSQLIIMKYIFNSLSASQKGLVLPKTRVQDRIMKIKFYVKCFYHIDLKFWHKIWSCSQFSWHTKNKWIGILRMTSIECFHTCSRSILSVNFQSGLLTRAILCYCFRQSILWFSSHTIYVL